MKIGLLGAGRMAQALGTRFAHTRHRICVGARDREKAAALAERLGADTEFGSLRDAAEFGDVLLLAVKRVGAADALRLSGAGDRVLAGKILIDCNNLGPDPDDMTSMAEEISSIAQGARVVKAFNCCHFEVWKLSPSTFDGRPLVVPICGDHDGAKAAVKELIAQLGARALDIGPLRKARHLEYLAGIVIGLLFSGFEPYTAFNLITSTEF